MKQLLNTMIISYNSLSFYLWWKEKLLKHYKSQNIMKLIVDKLVNRDIKQLKNSLSATKVSRNDEKNELLWIFKSQESTFWWNQNYLLETGISITNSVKYFGLRTDKVFHWHDQKNNITVRLNRTNELLLKMRNYVKMEIFGNICCAIFDSNLTYSCIAWAQNINTVNRLIIPQKKALRIMHFKDQFFHQCPLFSKNNILKFGDKITSQ